MCTLKQTEKIRPWRVLYLLSVRGFLMHGLAPTEDPMGILLGQMMKNRWPRPLPQSFKVLPEST